MRRGAAAIMVEDEWGRPVDPQKVEDALRVHPEASIVAFVHAETSTGARSDARTLCRIAGDQDCLSIVDAVTSLGGIELSVDDWGADAVYSGTQKCLSCAPGISPVTFSARAVDAISARGRKQSWFLDLELVMGYWGDGAQRTYHHTAPVNALYALHEALLILQEEGLENAWTRHQQQHEQLAAGLHDLGIELLVEPEWRLPQLNTVRIPAGVDDAAVRQQLLLEHGLMGHSCNEHNVRYCLDAVKAVLN